MRYASDHKAETRKRVLAEAAREIRAKGLENVAVAGVMARAGLTHGGFYAHFASKDALVVEALGMMFEAARARAPGFEQARGRAPGSEEEADPRAALRGYVAFYLSRGHRDARELGCPIPALSGDLARSSAPARERFASGVAGLTARLATLLRAIDADDPDGEAQAMLAQMVGAVLLARAVEGEASDAILRNTRAAVFARYDLEAIA